MSEVAITASELIVVGRGRLIASGSVQDVIRGATAGAVLVRTNEAERLTSLLATTTQHIQRLAPDTLQVSGMDSAAIGVIAAREQIPLIELTPQQATLEQAFMEITRDSVEFHGRPASNTDTEPAAAGGQR
jgi:ABC-2 type transport system ATP-binding protein